MTFALPKKTYILWRLRALCAFVLLCLTFVVFCRFSIKVLLPTLIAVANGSVLIFVYLHFYLKNYKIFADNTCICINKGVIVKSTIILPYSRLAVAKSFATPLLSALNLKFVALKSTRNWLILPELDFNQVELLLRAVKNE